MGQIDHSVTGDPLDISKITQWLKRSLEDKPQSLNTLDDEILTPEEAVEDEIVQDVMKLRNIYIYAALSKLELALKPFTVHKLKL